MNTASAINIDSLVYTQCLLPEDRHNYIPTGTIYQDSTKYEIYKKQAGNPVNNDYTIRACKIHGHSRAVKRFGKGQSAASNGKLLLRQNKCLTINGVFNILTNSMAIGKMRMALRIKGGYNVSRAQ